jgi:hypothetical protein
MRSFFTQGWARLDPPGEETWMLRTWLVDWEGRDSTRDRFFFAQSSNFVDDVIGGHVATSVSLVALDNSDKRDACGYDGLT